MLLAFSPFGSLEKSASRSGSHTALIEVKGMIADDEPASADNIVTLRAAFRMRVPRDRPADQQSGRQSGAVGLYL